mgnify:CR=1 FL=1
MNKAIFLDRDGTINVEKDYIYKCEDLVFEEGSVEALKTFKNLGYILIVVSNQSGIARGYFTEEDLKAFNNNMNEKLKEETVEITEFYCCPHHPDGLAEYKKVCECRKPKPGMINQAIKDYDVNPAESFLIGDSQRDVDAAEAAGVKGYLFTGTNLLDFIKTII